MQDIRCNTCGSTEYEERRITYLYSHQGQYLIVPNTPVEICSDCGTVYYRAEALKDIEKQFFAIRNHTETPDEYLQVPVKSM
ncbi:type II toxin-antitoxin system MqsA family antitoxin [Leptolyngbya sp. CCNP1308]|uniref:type II toxin-antitoxin system MqsA family antitoxin n=1 Tax=Leptolyngbya sp. CCNP1308 TaxID=3110255 RepID=UPI002B1F341A|nr:type II toxin-antitoxin system MqsA family antitoxin [Leptolyngbya sp. CCNP1308]MEA5450618.1 type II toxin-antitoxin system MqsA family antitoxin [Leptolyngbya sp. CCNP1308]